MGGEIMRIQRVPRILLGTAPLATNHGQQAYCAGTSDEITAEFSQPVLGRKIEFRGKYPQTLTITESGRRPFNVDFYPVYRNGGLVGGAATAYLSGKKISGVKVKSDDSEFAFSIQSLSVHKLLNSSRAGKNPPPNYCNVPPIDRPVPQIINSHDWTMDAEVSDDDGLVLTDVKLKGRLMAERISVPYYQLTTNQSGFQRGELRPADTGGPLRSRLVYYEPKIDADRLVVKATYAIDSISATSQSCLSITQIYEFERKDFWGVCAPDPTTGHLSTSCSRWKASAIYSFRGVNGETVADINVAQRNHFNVNGRSRNSVGLFQDCDNSPFLLGCFPSGNDILFSKKLNPLYTEQLSHVASRGKNLRQWDNIHQTYRSKVSEPVTLENLSKFIAGGCPECLHSHWRWGKPNGEKFGNGNLLFPSGSDQDLSIGIVRLRGGEDDPANFLELIDTFAPEPIRTRVSGVTLLGKEDNHYEVVK